MQRSVLARRLPPRARSVAGAVDRRLRARRRRARKLVRRWRRQAAGHAWTTAGRPDVGWSDRLADWGGRLLGTPTTPLVSVVLPVYNVAPYLDECLDSIRAQTYRRLQIIAVDDGSTDGSAGILERHRRADRRIRVVRKENAGLGAARNTGMRHVRGTLVCFVDSDDRLPRQSIALLVRSLAASGSDFAVGGLSRFDEVRSWVPPWAQDVHRKRRTAITLSELPDVLKNVFAWNKMFRTDFYRRVVREFPEGVRYEDQEATARAYVGGVFDVLEEVVYEWRERHDGTSITQQKSNLADLLDRLDVKRRVGHIIAGYPDADVRRSWFAKAAGFDLRPYFEVVPRTDQSFFDRLRAGLRDLTAEMDDEVWHRIVLIDRLPALAVLQGHRDDVCTLMIRRERYGWAMPAEVVDGELRLRPSYREQLQLEATPELLVFSPQDGAVLAAVTGLAWDGPVLELTGYAYLRGVHLGTHAGAPGPLPTITLELLGTRSGVLTEVLATGHDSPQIDIDSLDAWSSHAGSGFTARVDTRELTDGPGTPENRELRLRVGTDGATDTTAVISLDHRGSAGRIPAGPADATGRWVIEAKNDGLRLLHKGPAALPVTGVTVQGLRCRISVAGPLPDRVEAVCSSVVPAAVLTVVPEPGGWQLVVDLPELGRTDTRVWKTTHSWSLQAVLGGRPRRFSWPGSSNELDAQFTADLGCRPACTRDGTLQLDQLLGRAVVEDARLDGDQLVLEGTISLPAGRRPAVALMTRDGQDTPVAALEPDAAGRFSTAVPLRDATGRPLTLVGRSARLLSADDPEPAPGSLPGRQLIVAESLAARLPGDLRSPSGDVTLTRSRHGGLWVTSRAPLRPDERGRLAQRRLHEVFERPAPVSERTVVFECFIGTTVSDSPLALFRELRRRDPELDLCWSVRDPAVPVPEGARRLLMNTRDWMETVHRAGYLVTNANLPFYFRKQSGQTFVQTWHGTPLKRIGNDVPSTNLSLSYRELMSTQVEEWDLLLAQNPFASGVLPQAFDYHGRVLDLGYPRNDSLVTDQDRAAEIRDRLGVPAGHRVLLYAPTWRDNVRDAHRRYALVDHLDHEALRRRLPDTTVLLRGHSNTVDSAGRRGGANVIDVSRHPDINELMVAADVLVTDYSSVMFDFCVTRRPILFLVPDLEQYRDTTRGFYLSLPEIAPGPLCADTAELITELARIDDVATRYAERYARFVERFAPHDDGRAAARVADLIWPATARTGDQDADRAGDQVAGLTASRQNSL